MTGSQNLRETQEATSLHGLKHQDVLGVRAAIQTQSEAVLGWLAGLESGNDEKREQTGYGLGVR